jgi:hypothetical protein
MSSPVPQPATLAERAMTTALLDRATAAATSARAVAARYGLNAAAERIEWALDFLEDAKLEAHEGR